MVRKFSIVISVGAIIFAIAVVFLNPQDGEIRNATNYVALGLLIIASVNYIVARYFTKDKESGEKTESDSGVVTDC